MLFYVFRKNSSSDPRPVVLATTLHHSRLSSKHPRIFSRKAQHRTELESRMKNEQNTRPGYCTFGQRTYFCLRLRPLPVPKKAITSASLAMKPTQTFEELDAEALVYPSTIYINDSAGKLSGVCASVIYRLPHYLMYLYSNRRSLGRFTIGLRNNMRGFYAAYSTLTRKPLSIHNLKA